MLGDKLCALTSALLSCTVAMFIYSEIEGGMFRFSVSPCFKRYS